VARAGALIIVLVLVFALSDLIVRLWEYRGAPAGVKWAVVAGAGAMAALGVLGLGLLRRRG